MVPRRPILRFSRDLNPVISIRYLRNHLLALSMSCNKSVQRYGNGCLRDTVTDAPFIQWAVRYTVSSAKRDQVAIKPEHFPEACAERDKLGRKSLIMIALHHTVPRSMGADMEFRLISAAVLGAP